MVKRKDVERLSEKLWHRGCAGRCSTGQGTRHKRTVFVMCPYPRLISPVNAPVVARCLLIIVTERTFCAWPAATRQMPTLSARSMFSLERDDYSGA